MLKFETQSQNATRRFIGFDTEAITIQAITIQAITNKS